MQGEYYLKVNVNTEFRIVEKTNGKTGREIFPVCDNCISRSSTLRFTWQHPNLFIKILSDKND